ATAFVVLQEDFQRDALHHLMDHVSHVVWGNEVCQAGWQREVVHGILFKGNMLITKIERFFYFFA
ncbi:MAG: hypothetical protein ACE3JN_02520, partial [Ectobacillus sp.]